MSGSYDDLFYYVSLSYCISIVPLLPYGSNAADIQLKTTDDCGPRITFNPGIPVFEKNHKSLYVSIFVIVIFCSKLKVSIEKTLCVFYSQKKKKNKQQKTTKKTTTTTKETKEKNKT
jgi:hypothetical protein